MQHSDQENFPIRYINKGIIDYQECLQQMQASVQHIALSHQSEIWQVSHPSVYTLGQAGKHEHVLDMKGQQLIQSDRGGQVTWHGPGQIVLYTLFHLGNMGIGPKTLVRTLENMVIAYLADFNITANNKKDAPGVYVDGAKIASVALRISKGVSYHGVSFNHHCDLSAFLRINPCGYPHLPVTNLAQLLNNLPDINNSAHTLIRYLSQQLHRQCIGLS